MYTLSSVGLLYDHSFYLILRHGLSSKKDKKKEPDFCRRSTYGYGFRGVLEPF